MPRMPECYLLPIDRTPRRERPPKAGCTYLKTVNQRNKQKMTTKKQSQKDPRTYETYQSPPPPEPGEGRIIGLDIHPDIHTAAIATGTTAHDYKLLSHKCDISLEQLLNWTKKELTKKDIILMEASANSFTICDKLRAQGLRAYVLESAKVAKHSDTHTDTDKIAASRIIRAYLGGSVPCVWQPDQATREKRELLHLYQIAVRDHTAATNALKGYLNQYTIRLGKKNIHHPTTHAWLKTQQPWTELQKHILETHIQKVTQSQERRQSLYKQISHQVINNEQGLRLMNILGIGLINAFALIASVGDIARFENAKKLVSYIGLQPCKQESGLGKRKKKKGNTGRKDIRYLLIQAAHAALRRKGTAINKWGMKIYLKKGNRNTAAFAVARKLLIQAWHSLKGHPQENNQETAKSLTIKISKIYTEIGKAERQRQNLKGSIKDLSQQLVEQVAATNREQKKSA